MSSTSTRPIHHDPDAVLDYSWDWSAWLAEGETITAQTVTADADAWTVSQLTAEAGVVTGWLAAKPGAEHTLFEVVCHVVTSAGREDDRSHWVLLTDR